MKKYLLLILISACTAGLSLSLQAEIIPFDISPPGTDAAVGLSPANEVPPVLNSAGSGNVVFTGVVLSTPPDTPTNQLSVSIGYGAWPGFTDLTGAITLAHIHGPAAVGATAPPLIDLLAPPGVHTLSPDPFSAGGIITGLFDLTDPQVADLRAGLYYINLHTDLNTGGEIRGQLIEHTNEPPVIVECPGDTTVECTSPEGASVDLVAKVQDADGDPLTVKWTVNGQLVQEDNVPAGDAVNPVDVPYSGVFPLGENTVVVTVVDDDEEEDSCEFTVTVEDTTPPVINKIEANPRMLWPPNHKFRNVWIKVDAEDLCGEVTTKIVWVKVKDSDKGDGNTKHDWKIVSDRLVKLRAERAGGGSGRTYIIIVKATDEAGNSTRGTVKVTVPHSRGN